MRIYLSDKRKKLELEEYLVSELNGTMYSENSVIEGIDIITLLQPNINNTKLSLSLCDKDRLMNWWYTKSFIINTNLVINDPIIQVALDNFKRDNRDNIIEDILT